MNLCLEKIANVELEMKVSTDSTKLAELMVIRRYLKNLIPVLKGKYEYLKL
jgi:hypothetical protein